MVVLHVILVLIAVKRKCVIKIYLSSEDTLQVGSKSELREVECVT